VCDLDFDEHPSSNHIRAMSKAFLRKPRADSEPCEAEPLVEDSVRTHFNSHGAQKHEFWLVLPL
jgi:hypothetical protein